VRRAALQDALATAKPPIHVTPATRDRHLAEQWFSQFEGAGLDGIVAKPLDITYQPDKRVMFKIKHERTADCVLAGFRWHKTSTAEQPLLGSMLLGLYGEDGKLHHVGVIGAFPAARRAALVDELEPLLLGPGDAHPWSEWMSAEAHQGQRLPGAVSRWNATKDLSFIPLRPERVVEVKYEHMEGDRFRHLAHFVRWRPDRTPQSCTYEQLERPVNFDLDDIVPGLR
jgi:ATP-dependent DNA ligase